MVSGRNLIVGAARLPLDRARPPSARGRHPPPHLPQRHPSAHAVAAGLAGYEQTQEGLAILAEYLVGGLSAERLRQLAGRVVAVHLMTTGASFPEVPASGRRRILTHRRSPPRCAPSGGGGLKDAIYLRGLHDVLGHLAPWRHPRPSLARAPAGRLPLVRDLADRGVLRVPRYSPATWPTLRQPYASNEPQGSPTCPTDRKQHMGIGLVAERPRYRRRRPTPRPASL